MKAVGKYLPVEGEPINGDTVVLDKNTGTIARSFDYGEYCYLDGAHQITKGDMKRRTDSNKGIGVVKLSAVKQKDLSIGDRDFFAMLNRIKPEEQETEFYEVLGELSPNATWVKDGDEIEVRILDDSGMRRYFPEATKTIAICQVKGPCGHYH